MAARETLYIDAYMQKNGACRSRTPLEYRKNRIFCAEFADGKNFWLLFPDRYANMKIGLT